MKSLLKFITCGSVDDGKSTLIGHILYDAKLLYADQKRALELDSKVGSRDGKVDYSLLLDGLMAEREQGITIDVAYRYFNTDNRSFIVADTPGHEEYTKNMAVGASFADLAVILADASQGVMIQTKRHARICSLMGIRYFVFAVNKMDLVGYSESRFREVENALNHLQEELGLSNVKYIPVSATEGDNITKPSPNMKWYKGEDILTYLENVDIAACNEEKGFYMPVQRVCRPNHKFRGFQGQIESGVLEVGDEVTVLPSHEKAKVKSINLNENKAAKGRAVTIQLDKELDVSRGCVLVKEADILVSNLVTASILWLDDEKLLVGRDFLLKLGTKIVPCTVEKIKYKVDINTGQKLKTGVLAKNEIALCNIQLSESIAVQEFKNYKTLGEFILIDRLSNMTSACGIIEKVYKDSDSKKEDIAFSYNGLEGRGDIFEEYYYDTENLSVYKYRGENKIYTVGDRIQNKGQSYAYPDSFDIIIFRDNLVVEVNEGLITGIEELPNYEYSGREIVNGRGFALKVNSGEELKTLLADYAALNEVDFLNKYADFTKYRKIVFGI